MNHRTASGLLADYRQNELDPEARAAVAGHLAACTACREWLATYDLLDRALAENQRLEHPDAEALATYAVGEATSRPETAAHIEHCATCRDETALVSAAIAAARVSRPRRTGTPRGLRSAGKAAAGWAAAGLVLVLLAGTLLFRPTEVSERDRVISGGSLTGNETFVARSIHASGVKIESGSHIAMEAEDLVAFGEGFVVASGASLQVGRALGDGL